MKVIVVDFAGFYPEESKKAVTSERRNGKFVQIRHGGKEYLVFSSAELTPYHADIVERFCREEGLDGTYDKSKKRFDIVDPEWVIAGGGKFEVDADERVVRLYDNSMAYGRFDFRGLGKKMLESGLPKGYKVVIE